MQGRNVSLHADAGKLRARNVHKLPLVWILGRKYDNMTLLLLTWEEFRLWDAFVLRANCSVAQWSDIQLAEYKVFCNARASTRRCIFPLSSSTSVQTPVWASLAGIHLLSAGCVNCDLLFVVATLGGLYANLHISDRFWLAPCKYSWVVLILHLPTQP